LLDLSTHQAVFTWVLGLLTQEGLLRGKTLGIDGTTLEANAALRSIVRRDTGEGYEEFLVGLAKSSGIETPTREDLARLDRKRAKKGSNQEWFNPFDPDAKITKMKDGRTHLAHKAEHSVDMETGAIVAVTLQPADRGDTASLAVTLEEAQAVLSDVAEDEGPLKGSARRWCRRWWPIRVTTAMQCCSRERKSAFGPIFRSRSAAGATGGARRLRKQRSTATAAESGAVEASG
jgi:hypothetical protein